MKRLLLSFCILIGYTLCTYAQTVTHLEDSQEDSVINVIAYFCKGDTMKYTYTDAVYKITQKDTITSSYYTRDCMIVVTDSTSKGYNMEFTPLDIKLANDTTAESFETKINVTILKTFNNIKVKFHTDELGNIEAIDNWREVRDLFLKGTKQAFDDFYAQVPGIDSFMPRKRFEGLIRLSVNNEASVRKCIEELPLLFDLHGSQFQLGTINKTDTTSSLYLTQIKAVATYMDDEDGTAGDYEISCSSTTRIPPEETTQLVSTVFQNIFSGELAEKGEAFVRDSLATYFKNDSMKVEQLEQYDLFDNGWPAHMQTMKSSGFSCQKKVEYKSIDWYYRSWKGYAMKEGEADKKEL